MKKKLLYLLIIVFVGFSVHGQFSKTHYIPPLSNSSSMIIGNKFIYISTPSINPINVQLKEIKDIKLLVSTILEKKMK